MKGEVRMEKKKFDFSSWIKVHVAEFKRIIWPSREETLKETLSVIIISLIFGCIIIAFDFVIEFGYNALVALLG